MPRRVHADIDNFENLPAPGRNFKNHWLEDRRLSGWLQAVGKEGQKHAYCKVCPLLLNNKIDSLVNHGATWHPELEAAHPNEAEHRFDDKRKELEILFCLFIVENSLPLEIIDNFVSFCKSSKLDPTVLAEVKIKQTKCRQIIMNILAAVETEKLVEILKNQKFSLLIDESTDITDKKQLAINVQYRCSVTGYAKVQLLQLLEVNPLAGTGKEIFEAFENFMDGLEIPFENIVSYTSDNASVMMGCNNSFLTNLKRRAPHVLALPCICHSSALACKCSLSHMNKDILDFIRGAYTYTSNSSKRRADFQNYQAEHNIDIKKILQLSGTRWLELYFCVDRILENASALRAYFEKEYAAFERKPEKRSEIVKKLAAIVRNKNIWPFLYFLKHFLNIFNKFNGYFQSNLTRIQDIIHYSDKLLSQIGSYFIKDELVPQIFNIDVLDEINYKPFQQIFIGTECLNFLTRNAHAFSDIEILQFKREYASFYAKAVNEIKTRFYANEPVYRALTFFDKDVALFGSEEYRAIIIDNLCNLSAINFPYINLHNLRNEWQLLLTTFDENELNRIRNFKNNEDLWILVCSLKNDNDQFIFPQFRVLVEAVVSIANSNSESERTFSIMNDIKSRKRNRIETPLLNALLVIKSALFARKETTINFKVTEAHLRKFNSLNMYNFNRREEN